MITHSLAKRRNFERCVLVESWKQTFHLPRFPDLEESVIREIRADETSRDRFLSVPRRRFRANLSPPLRPPAFSRPSIAVLRFIARDERFRTTAEFPAHLRPSRSPS